MAQGWWVSPMIVADHGPRGVTWDMSDAGGVVMCDESGAAITADAAFMRQDVFRYLRTGDQADALDARAWRVLFDGWLAANPEIGRFNAGFLAEGANKPHALLLAAQAGLPVPRTRVTALVEAAAAMLEDGDTIYKPIDGGDHCRALTHEALIQYVSGLLPRPYILQERLIAPELRVFRIGDPFMSFRVDSPSLDYREHQDAALSPVPTPPQIIPGLRRLTDALGLDFCAADFKTRASDGALCFMEVNSNPMFAAFDDASEGALCRAMLATLGAGR